MELEERVSALEEARAQESKINDGNKSITTNTGNTIKNAYEKIEDAINDLKKNHSKERDMPDKVQALIELKKQVPKYHQITKEEMAQLNDEMNKIVRGESS